jgi:uncharacterized protein YbcI
VLDDLLEAVPHDLLEDHALTDDVLAVAALEQGLLDPGEPAAQQADDEGERRVRVLRPSSASRGPASKTVEEAFAMANPPEARTVDDDALRAVAQAMVALHTRYHGRAPRTSRTMMMGEDMLACLLGDVYTDVEKTMIELQREALVHETRSAFQQAMEHRFIAVVERHTGRKVQQFISTHHVGPDLELELFVLEP